MFWRSVKSYNGVCDGDSRCQLSVVVGNIKGFGGRSSRVEWGVRSMRIEKFHGGNWNVRGRIVTLHLVATDNRCSRFSGSSAWRSVLPSMTSAYS